MSIETMVSDDGSSLNIKVNGRFDFNDHQDFRAAYECVQKDASFTLDMADTEYMDSSALGMLLMLREHAGGEGANIRITNCRDELKNVLTIANFQKLFDIR